MGIFTVPTVAVRNTRIYVSPSSSIPGEQLTLYKTEVNTHFEGGFLILPVPYPRTVEFHRPSHPYPPNQSPYLDFLNRVERAFDSRENRRRIQPIDPLTLATYERVEVLESIEELREFNDEEHILHESTLNQIAEIYHQDYWGFLLCSLRQGSFVYEPLCYTHRMVRDEFFIPSLIYQPRAFNDVVIPQEEDRFHDRYFMNGCEYGEPMGYRVQEVETASLPGIPWDVLPMHYRRCLRYFLSETRRGMHWNRDAQYRVNRYLLWDPHSPRERRFSDDIMYSPICPW